MEKMENSFLIIVNPYCHQNKGYKRWLSIQSEVISSFSVAPRIVMLEKVPNPQKLVTEVLLENKAHSVISAGGDGSIHNIINAVMNTEDINKQNFSIGAIGLGSSNDFLKPFSAKIKNIPVRINDEATPVFHDLGSLKFTNAKGAISQKYFIINSSFGVTAQANYNFNNPSKILQFLKSNSTDLAIFFTAIKTIFGHKNQKCTIQFNETEMEAMVSNINVLKVPYVSGSFHYNDNIKRDDGLLSLKICLDMTKPELISTLINLSAGNFKPSNKRISSPIKAFSISSATPMVVECDGETALSYNVSVSILPQVIKVLSA